MLGPHFSEIAMMVGYLHNTVFIMITNSYAEVIQDRLYSVVVITPDFDHIKIIISGDPGSNPGTTYFFDLPTAF